MAGDKSNAESNEPRTDFTEAPLEPARGQNALPIGTRLNQFEILELIGEGGFGIVYLAQDHTLHRRVALKEYLPSTLAGRGEGSEVVLWSEKQRETFSTGLRSFVNEARILARYDHPALLKVYQFWEANGTAYMAMPFMSGRNLRDVLGERGPMPDETWIAAILAPLMEALELIHADNCYHRDISPDNIMLLAGDRPVLLDFGAARQVINDMTRALTVMLKPGYAPIEQYADVPGSRQGAWTDIYALGAVVHFMIRGDKPPSSVSRMIKDSYKPLAATETGRYSERFLKGIDQCLAIKPEDRPQSIAEMRRVIGFDKKGAVVPAPEANAGVAIGFDKKAATVTAPEVSAGDTSAAEKESTRSDELRSAHARSVHAAPALRGEGGRRRRMYILIGAAIGFATLGAAAAIYLRHTSQAGDPPGISPAGSTVSSPAPLNSATQTHASPPDSKPEAIALPGAQSPISTPPSAREDSPRPPASVPTPASGSAPVSASLSVPVPTATMPSGKPAPAAQADRPTAAVASAPAPVSSPASASATVDVTLPKLNATEPGKPGKEANAANIPERVPGTLFRDCPDCPELVVVPPGVFQMGSPPNEEGRRKNEGPVHDVTIKGFAIGKTEVTRGQYSGFVAATGHPAGKDCWVYNGEKWLKQDGKGWRDPGFRQDDNHPVVCVSWDDAQAYVAWLSSKTGKRYRLPSEAEWEYAARAGTRAARPWGGTEAEACEYANLAIETRQFTLFGLGNTGSPNCRDTYTHTSPAGTMKANAFGLHDLIGNASEWVEDCFDGSYVGAPADGSPRVAKSCASRVMRGGSWDVNPVDARVARRDFDVPSSRLDGSGFRVVRVLP